MATQPEPVEPQAAPINAEDFYVNDQPKGGDLPEGGEGGDVDEPLVDDDGNAIEPVEDDDEQQVEETPLDAPKSWSKEDREGWATIPRAQQEIISRRETERDKHLREVSTKASQTEQRVQGEARQVLLQIHQNHAQQLEQYAGMFNPQQPDLRLLNSDDPNDRSLYFQQEAQYRHAAAHREQANRQALEARQQAEQLQQHELMRAQEEFHSTLTEQVPEWSDPSERANLLANLGSIAAELGYSAEVQNEANASDILALRKAYDWKAKADKYDALMKKKMVPVRQARQLPPNARTTVPGAVAKQGYDPVAAMYPNDPPRR